MVRHIHLDVVGGIAGDMFVAAIADAFPELQHAVVSGVKKILPADVGLPEFFEELHTGIRVLRFRLDAADDKSVDKHRSVHRHGIESTYTYLKSLIADSELSDLTKNNALGILSILAVAEAKIHQTSLTDVHFHELADWDSLMDVVAAGIILAQLDGADWSVSALPRGAGMVNTQHGMLPVPAPATAEILCGFEFFDDGVSGERITPTGAAILKFIFADAIKRAAPVATLACAGYSAGSRQLEGMPNILRALCFTSPESSILAETIARVEFDIDDMSGEEIAWAAESLRAFNGIIDVAVGSAQGKKNRALAQFGLLAHSGKLSSVIDACFQFTSTLGVRWRMEQRFCLSRYDYTGENQDGSLPYKTARRPDGALSTKVESDALAGHMSLVRRRRAQRRIESKIEKDADDS